MRTYHRTFVSALRNKLLTLKKSDICHLKKISSNILHLQKVMLSDLQKNKICVTQVEISLWGAQTQENCSLAIHKRLKTRALTTV